MAGASTPQVQDALRLSVEWYTGAGEGAGQLNAVFLAVMVVATGQCRHVLVYRTVTEGSAQGSGRREGIGVNMSGGLPDYFNYLIPYGAASAVNWCALYADRHMYEYGTTREQLAQIALNARRNAGLNPKGIYREPLTMDDYFAARMISSPLCLYDCDIPCDGSTAVVVSNAAYAKDAPRLAPRVETFGTALYGRPRWEQWEDLTTMVMHDSAAQMWTRTDLEPSDVDIAELYDGFSILTLLWIEALQFVGRGEAGPFLEGGRRIALEGELPINTHGGQLSAGRLHGYSYLHEAIVQLRGDGGDRQVVKALDVAAVAAGGGNTCGCLLLTR